MMADGTGLESTSEISLEMFDALRAASARGRFLLHLLRHEEPDALALEREVQSLLKDLDVATQGLLRLHPENEEPNGLKQDVVLIIDDEPAYARALRRRLEAIGMNAYHEVDPTQAVKAFGVLRPATVFVDALMPQRDGVLVAAELKQIAPDATVVLVTGYLTAERVYQAAHFGADRIVEKGDIEPLLQIARGELPAERVVRSEKFPTEAEAKQQHAQAAMDRFGSLTAAAQSLGIDVRTLERRLNTPMK